MKCHRISNQPWFLSSSTWTRSPRRICCSWKYSACACDDPMRNIAPWFTGDKQIKTWYPCDIHVISMWYPCDIHVISMWYPCDIHDSAGITFNHLEEIRSFSDFQSYHAKVLRKRTTKPVDRCLIECCSTWVWIVIKAVAAIWSTANVASSDSRVITPSPHG